MWSGPGRAGAGFSWSYPSGTGQIVPGRQADAGGKIRFAWTANGTSSFLPVTALSSSSWALV